MMNEETCIARVLTGETDAYRDQAGERVEAAGRAVAAALSEVFGSFEMGGLVSVTPVGYGEKFVMHEISFTASSTHKAGIAPLALAHLRLVQDKQMKDEPGK